MRYSVDKFVEKLDKIRDKYGEGDLELRSTLKYLDEISDLVTNARKRIENKSKKKKKKKKKLKEK